MSDLIDRQAAIKALEAKKDKSAKGDIGCFYNTIIQNDIDALKALPSAQSKIIRCKDCENWIPGYITDNDDFIPPKCGKYQQMVGHSSNDYCSLAERRTDG